MKKQTIIALLLVLILELVVTIGVAALLVFIFSISDNNCENYAVDLIIGIAASFVATFIMLYFTNLKSVSSQVKKVQAYVVRYLYTQGYDSASTRLRLYVDNSFVNHLSNFYCDVCSLISIKKANISLDNFLHIMNTLLDEAKANCNSYYDFANLFSQLSSASEALW